MRFIKLQTLASKGFIDLQKAFDVVKEKYLMSKYLDEKQINFIKKPNLFTEDPKKYHIIRFICKNKYLVRTFTQLINKYV